MNTYTCMYTYIDTHTHKVIGGHGHSEHANPHIHSQHANPHILAYVCICQCQCQCACIHTCIYIHHFCVTHS